MKNFFETIKDIIYDSIDYIIMLGIIGVVVVVIGWRLDLLFAKDAFDIPPKGDIVASEDDDPKDKPPTTEGTPEPNAEDEESPEENPENSNSGNGNIDTAETPPKDSNTEINTPSSEIVKVTIPSGSLPSKIGSILESNGLVASRNDFVQKSQELKLDTKLKSGTFEISISSTLEEIIRQIAK